jgi:putative phage-type endonuclease
MLISELEDLQDITDTLTFDDEPSIFTEENTLELIETSFYLMEEYMHDNPTTISEPNFHEIILEEVKEMFYVQLEDHILENDYIEDDLNDLLEDAFNIFISTFHPERSLDYSNNESSFQKYDESYIQDIEEKIQRLRDIPQPEQRTPEWYEFRWNLITASNAYKVFESQSTINQLIYEKCQPLKTNVNEDEEVKMINVNTPLHWGQKYEPLSVLIYENNYKTKVEDFGCIQHKDYKFLGASPDGINIDKTSEKYGRMLEIKNVVSREINGIPKKEYWVQMQLQMEVCNLDECDFLETKFIEYADRQSFIDDISSEVLVDSNGPDFLNVCLSKNGKIKGKIIYFHTKEGKPFYVYKPLECFHPNDIEEWQNSTVDIYTSEPYNYTYMKTIFWKLEVLSCVQVSRNREWFKNNVLQIEKIWKIIEEERITGFQHRAPIKKPKKEIPTSFSSINSTSQGCLLKFNNIIKIDTEIQN